MAKAATTKLTITLPAKAKALIEQQAETENFASTGEFIVQMFKEKLVADEQKRIEHLLLEGLESPLIDLSPDMKDDAVRRLKQRHATRRNAKKAG